ncbi:MAG: hypothetical protein B7Y41_11810 [Hydrogenophilales bacterium 28-61-23]|nr:MAG: hypothetical protein B7Y41_11810 [Hydrogenophilales bacterium 28-61-23]
MSRKNLPRVSLCLALGLCNLPAQAVNITGTLTADNHYALYAGQPDGSGLAYVGRNEIGDSGNPGIYNFSFPETWHFNVAAGDRLYVVAWDDGGPQMFLGNFNWESGLIVSDLASWEYYVPDNTNQFVPNGATPITTADLGSLIATANWSAPSAQTPNSNNPTWGTIPGVSATAAYIWHDGAWNDWNSSSDGKYVVFRSVVSPVAVPEPETWAMLLAGFGLVGLMARRGYVFNRRT